MTSPPKYQEDLPKFISQLRSRLFKSQEKAATYFGVTRPTITRYETGYNKPPLGYLACLAQLLADRQEEAEVATYRKALLSEVNRAIRQEYEYEAPFEDWRELCQVADEYLAKKQSHNDVSILESFEPNTRSKTVENGQQSLTDLGPTIKDPQLPIQAIVISIAAIFVIVLVIGIIFVPGQINGQLPTPPTGVTPEVAAKSEQTANLEVPTATPVLQTATVTALPATETSTPTSIPSTATLTPASTPTNLPSYLPPTASPNALVEIS